MFFCRACTKIANNTTTIFSRSVTAKVSANVRRLANGVVEEIPLKVTLVKITNDISEL